MVRVKGGVDRIRHLVDDAPDGRLELRDRPSSENRSREWGIDGGGAHQGKDERHLLVDGAELVLGRLLGRRLRELPGFHDDLYGDGLDIRTVLQGSKAAPWGCLKEEGTHVADALVDLCELPQQFGRGRR